VKKRGGGKIYLDFLQNRRGQTLAAPYCARPKPGATVSAPLKWEEVKSGLQLADFHHQRQCRSALKKAGDLFTGVLGKGLDMEAALEKLNE
jgi:bifunctional non-homologous end joining protein LigD